MNPVAEAALLHNTLLLATLLFGIGLVGVLARRNMIVVGLSLEIMLQAVCISLVAWGRFHHDTGGPVFVLALVAVIASQAIIAVALGRMLYRSAGTFDLTHWSQLREVNGPLRLGSIWRWRPSGLVHSYALLMVLGVLLLLGLLVVVNA